MEDKAPELEKISLKNRLEYLKHFIIKSILIYIKKKNYQRKV